MVPGRLPVWAGFCSFDLWGGSGAAQHPPRCHHQHMPGSFFQLQPHFRHKPDWWVPRPSQEAKAQLWWWGQRGEPSPARPQRICPQPTCANAFRRKIIIFRAAKLKHFYLKPSAEGRVSYAATVVGKAAGLTLAACWAPGLLLSHGCPLLPKPLYSGGICKKENKKEKRKRKKRDDSRKL